MKQPGLLAKSLPWFEEWRRVKAEPVPDFSKLARISDLPPLMEFADGRPVQSLSDWESRRIEIKDLLCRYFLGSLPASRPQLAKVKILRQENELNALRQVVELTFGENPSAAFIIETLMPNGPGPFPVFMTQKTHRAWGVLALSRGYMVCVYPASDGDDQSANFTALYPECDWGKIPRRAWSASRALDYLLTLPEVDRERIGITGHSRNGKQALIAAALDPRITAVVSSSSGSGGACSYRFSREPSAAEGVEVTTHLNSSDWYHPRIRYFTGFEDRFPIDFHGLPALIAPRHCLFSTALNDDVEPYPSVERCYLAGQEAYRFLGSQDNFRIRWRPGRHETCADDVHSYLDFFDTAFGRGNTVFPEKLLYHFNWTQWRHKEKTTATPPVRKTAMDTESLKEIVRWGLGEQPPVAVQYGNNYGSEPEHLADRKTNPSGIQRLRLNFSDYVRGDLYFPEDAEELLPTVIWLHPYSFAAGYSGFTGECIGELNPYHWIAKQGYAVFTFDQLGCGGRILEGADFYARYPRWSKLGKMLRDVRAAVDVITEDVGRFATAPDPQCGKMVKMPLLDPYRVFCLGYSLGGLLGLYAAALDDRIAGVASFCGFSPMRMASKGRQAGMLERLCFWHGLQPQLGLFKGRENELPYDFEDILSLIAPRPCLVVAPKHDCDADYREVGACVDKARASWQSRGAPENITYLEPDDYSRFQTGQYSVFLDWFKQALQKVVTPPDAAERKPWLDSALSVHREKIKLKKQPAPSVNVKSLSGERPDGDPSKVDWSRIESLSSWYTVLGDPCPRKLDLRMAHDDLYLYVHLADHTDTSKLLTDKGIWNGDDWELFFASRREQKAYHQIGVNPCGEYIALAIEESCPAVWESGVKIKTDILKNCWKISMALPLAGLLPDGARAGQPFYANFFRCNPGKMVLAWSPVFELNFHILDRMGKIHLAE